MSIFGSLIWSDYLFITPSVFMIGFFINNLINSLIEVPIEIIPEIKMTKEEIFLNFNTKLKHILLFSDIKFKQEHNQLLNNNLFLNCIKDWIFWSKQNNFNGIFCFVDKNVARTDLKIILIDLMNCKNIDEIKNLGIEPFLLEAIVQDISCSIDFYYSK